MDFGFNIFNSENLCSVFSFLDSDNLTDLNDCSLFDFQEQNIGSCFENLFKNNDFDEETLAKHEVYARISCDCKSDYETSLLKDSDYKRILTENNDGTGFNAAVYKNSEDNEIVIAYRCTANQEGVKSDIQMIKGEIPKQYYDADSLYQQIKEKYPNKKIVLTGHSLGGSLAQLVASAHSEVPAITFDAYGTEDIIENNANFKDNRNCICYTTDGSLVSGASFNPGQTITVKCQKSDNDDDSILNTIAEEIKNRHDVTNYFDLDDTQYACLFKTNIVRNVINKIVKKLIPCLEKNQFICDIIPKLFFD